MKYFFDTVFNQVTSTPFMGTSERYYYQLISIGIVSETIDGHETEYYAVSKDFNIKEAWNSKEFDSLYSNAEAGNVLWLRNKVLHSVFFDLALNDYKYRFPYDDEWLLHGTPVTFDSFIKEYGHDYGMFRHLVKKYGKENKVIADEIRDFISYSYPKNYGKKLNTDNLFLGINCAYDWIVLSQLYSGFNSLPDVFPRKYTDIDAIAQLYCPPGYTPYKPLSTYTALGYAKYIKQVFKEIYPLKNTFANPKPVKL